MSDRSDRRPDDRGARRDLRRARVRITAVTVLCVVVVLTASGAALLQLFERELVDQTDTALQSAAQKVDGLAAFISIDPRVGNVLTSNDYVQAIDATGTVIVASPPLDGAPALWHAGDETRPHTIVAPNGVEVRVIASPLGNAWVVYGMPLDAVEDHVHVLRTSMLIAFIPVALALGAVIWIAVGWTLRPVRASIEREEQLVADVSHELRSPIAGMRALLETEPYDLASVRESRHDTLIALGRIETITNQLLLLMRHDRDADARSRPVDLDDLVRVAIEQIGLRVTIDIDASGVEPGQVMGNPHDLESLVANLLANAVRHALTVVQVHLSEAEGEVELTVDDDGPGVPPSERERVFERFTRLDESRARDDGGAGLGLAIVRAVAEAHGGTVVIEDAPIGGARFVVRLPASTRPARVPVPSA